MLIANAAIFQLYYGENKLMINIADYHSTVGYMQVVSQ
jgi:hypothetical protein